MRPLVTTIKNTKGEFLQWEFERAYAVKLSSISLSLSLFLSSSRDFCNKFCDISLQQGKLKRNTAPAKRNTAVLSFWISLLWFLCSHSLFLWFILGHLLLIFFFHYHALILPVLSFSLITPFLHSFASSLVPCPLLTLFFKLSTVQCHCVINSIQTTLEHNIHNRMQQNNTIAVWF